MGENWAIDAEGVWKRYSRTLRKSVRYALADSLRSFFGRSTPSEDLREDEFWSLRDVSFRIMAGEGLAIIGANGAGKSTLLKILSGVVAPDRGAMRVRGRLVSLMLAGAGFHPLLTGRENVLVYGALLGLRRDEIAARMPAIVAFAELGDFLDTPIKYYSSGMHMRLGFSVAAHCDPEVFVVDEALAVGDAAFREKCLEHLMAMKRRGCTLLIVSHSLSQLRRLADKGLWLHRGECAAMGPIEPVLDSYLAALEAKHDTVPLAADVPIPLAGPADAPPLLPSAALTATPTVPHRLELHADDATRPLRLPAHTTVPLVVSIHFAAPVVEPTLAIRIVAMDGRTLAGSAVAMTAATWPQPHAGSVFHLHCLLRAHLATQEGHIEVSVRESTRVLVTRSWPCQIESSVDTLSIAELEVELTQTPAAEHAPTSVCTDDPAVIAPGAPMTVDMVTDTPATAWLLLDSAGDVVARMPLPRAVGASAIRGTFRAHLPPGDFTQALELTGRRLSGSSLQVMTEPEPIGHALLAGRCHVEEPRTPMMHEPSLRLIAAELTGDSNAMADLLGGALRLRTNFATPTVSLIALAAGEGCVVRCRIAAPPDLQDWEISLGFRHPLRGRCAAMRWCRHRITAPSGSFDLVFAFEVQLAPGEYLLGCTAAARDGGGQRTEVQALDFARCIVLGSGDTTSDGRLEIQSWTELPLPNSTLPSPANEAAELRTSGFRLLRCAVNGVSGAEHTQLPAGVPATIEVDVLATIDVAEPSFKFAFVNHAQRCVARMSGFPSGHHAGPLSAGTARRYRMVVIPHLVGGVYEAQFALLRRIGSLTEVTDRRQQGAVCLVPSSGQPSGPGLLQFELTLDARQSARR